MPKPEDHFDSSLASQHIDTIRSELAKYDGINTYIKGLHARFARCEAGVQIEEIAHIMEPVDRTLGQDDEERGGFAFYKGGLLGLRVGREMIGHDFSRQFVSSPPMVPDVESMDTDDAERQHELSQSLWNLAEQGYDQASPFHGFMEEIEDEVAFVRHQPYLRRGFGLVMYQVHRILKENSLKQLQRELDGSTAIDWDAAAAQHLFDQ